MGGPGSNSCCSWGAFTPCLPAWSTHTAPQGFTGGEGGYTTWDRGPCCLGRLWKKPKWNQYSCAQITAPRLICKSRELAADPSPDLPLCTTGKGRYARCHGPLLHSAHPPQVFHYCCEKNHITKWGRWCHKISWQTLFWASTGFQITAWNSSNRSKSFIFLNFNLEEILPKKRVAECFLLQMAASLLISHIISLVDLVALHGWCCREQSSVILLELGFLKIEYC